MVLGGNKAGRRLFQLLDRDVRVTAGADQAMKVTVIGIGVVVVWRVIRTLRMAVGMCEVRRFHREVAVRVDAQNQPVRGADAAAREHRKGEYEDEAGAG